MTFIDGRAPRVGINSNDFGNLGITPKHVANFVDKGSLGEEPTFKISRPPELTQEQSADRVKGLNEHLQGLSDQNRLLMGV